MSINKKPVELIRLLNEVLSEQDNSKIQETYLRISIETMKIQFKEIGNRAFTDIFLKKYIQLAMKEYAYSLRSKESTDNLKDLIDIIKDFDIL